MAGNVLWYERSSESVQWSITTPNIQKDLDTATAIAALKS